MTPEQVIRRIAEVAEAVGWQANIGASETAGMIISCLAAKPHLIDRFLREGHVLLLEDEIGPDHGILTFHRKDGQVTTPQELRVAKQVKRMEREAK